MGALQGPDSDIELRTAKQFIKQLTKGLYGLRPKALNG
nr:DUF535 family protein [Photobacterium leiognathi]